MPVMLMNSVPSGHLQRLSPGHRALGGRVLKSFNKRIFGSCCVLLLCLWGRPGGGVGRQEELPVPRNSSSPPGSEVSAPEEGVGKGSWGGRAPG